MHVFHFEMRAFGGEVLQTNKITQTLVILLANMNIDKVHLA